MENPYKLIITESNSGNLLDSLGITPERATALQEVMAKVFEKSDTIVPVCVAAADACLNANELLFCGIALGRNQLHNEQQAQVHVLGGSEGLPN